MTSRGASPKLQGLTGFENVPVVVSYAAASPGAAFGLAGLPGALVLRRDRVSSVTLGFLFGSVEGADS